MYASGHQVVYSISHTMGPLLCFQTRYALLQIMHFISPSMNVDEAFVAENFKGLSGAFHIIDVMSQI